MSEKDHFCGTLIGEGVKKTAPQKENYGILRIWYPRGTLVEFRLHLGGGPKTCRGLVLNTAVCAGKGARQVWILDMDDPTPALEAQWMKKKFIVPENDILCIIPRTIIGGETLLRDNPVCYPVRDLQGEREIPAVEVTVPYPVPKKD